MDDTTATNSATATAEPAAITSTPVKDGLSAPLRRSREDRMLSGVCGGLARNLDMDAVWLRLGLVLATVLGFGAGVLVYLAAWILMPEEPATPTGHAEATADTHHAR